MFEGKTCMRPAFLILFTLFFGGTALSQEAGTDPGRLLDLAAKAQSQEARRILSQVIKILGENKKLRPQEDLDVLTERFARSVEKSARTAKEVQAIFGEKTQKTIARQIYYRRYQEQWVFDMAVRLTVVFDCIKGREPTVLAVLVPIGEK